MSTTYPIKDKAILKQMKDYYLEKERPRNYALIIMGLNTALRISDILTLQWKDVYNYTKRTFRVHICLKEQKTGKESITAINSAAKSALTLILREQGAGTAGLPPPNAYIFTSSRSNNMPLSRFQAYRIVKEAAVYSGMEEHVSCHSLRKTFGYFAWKQGVPPAMLMSIYNHSSYQITKRYLCIEQDDKDDVFMKIKL